METTLSSNHHKTFDLMFVRNLRHRLKGKQCAHVYVKYGDRWTVALLLLHAVKKRGWGNLNLYN